MPESKFTIGWGEADITPQNLKLELFGQYYQRIATGLHSRIGATAIIIEKGDEQVVEVSMDLVGIEADFQNHVADVIAEALPGIKKENVFLNAIHTHNAPYPCKEALFREWCPISGDTLDPLEYFDFATAQVLQAVQNAWNNRQPASVKRAFANARIGHCRRAVYSNGTAEMYGDTTRDDFRGMEAGEDSGVELLFTYTADHKPTGLILNVACPSQVMEATYLISSDYMGETRALLKAQFGEDFHTLCQISAAGCQSPRDLTRNTRTEPDFWHADGVTEVANRLFKAIMAPTNEGDIEDDPVFTHTIHHIELPVRRASYDDYVKAQKEYARLEAIMPLDKAFFAFCDETHANEAIPNRPGPFDSKLHHFVLMMNEKAVIARYKSQDKNPFIEYDMQTFRIGECAWVNVPFELYLLFGQIIKVRSKARQTFVVQLSSAVYGYLPSPDAERLGGYGGLIINGTVGSDGGFLLADTAVSNINKLFV